MGQYYKAVLVNEKWDVKVIRPSGWKLMEHSWYENESMNRIQKLLLNNVCNVYWVWDYSAMSWLIWKHFKEVEEKSYDEKYDEDELLDIKNSKKDYFLVNETSREFINMSKQIRNEDLFEDNWESVIHPLPLLCRNKSEEAGWDYHSDVNKDLIGIWEWDEIRIVEWWVDVEMELSQKYDDRTDVYFFKE